MSKKFAQKYLKGVKDEHINRLKITRKSFKNQCGGYLMLPNQFVQNNGRQGWVVADREQLSFVILLELLISRRVVALS